MNYVDSVHTRISALDGSAYRDRRGRSPRRDVQVQPTHRPARRSRKRASDELRAERMLHFDRVGHAVAAKLQENIADQDACTLRGPSGLQAEHNHARAAVEIELLQERSGNRTDCMATPR